MLKVVELLNKYLDQVPQTFHIGDLQDYTFCVYKGYRIIFKSPPFYGSILYRCGEFEEAAVWQSEYDKVRIFSGREEGLLVFLESFLNLSERG